MKRGLVTVLLAAVIFLLICGFLQSALQRQKAFRQRQEYRQPPPESSSEIDLGETTVEQ